MMRAVLARFRPFNTLRSTGETLWVYAIWAVTGWFLVNLLALIGSVIVSSFATRWLRSWLPDGWTLRWY